MNEWIELDEFRYVGSTFSVKRRLRREDVKSFWRRRLDGRTEMKLSDGEYLVVRQDYDDVQAMMEAVT